MADTRLVEFVRDALKSGATRDETEAALIESGWSREQVAGAMRAFSPTPFPIPVPRPAAQVSARDAALYLVMFVMLYLTAYHVGSLLFELIEFALPDPLIDGNASSAFRVRWSASVVIVSFPLFLFAASRVAADIARDPTNRTSAVRRWLTHLTLAVATFVLAGDLIAVINSLLGGELSARFLLKALTVGTIAGAIFWYYLDSIRGDQEALSQ
ncbi:MAG TPA: DUF5671 domain-containing protein [Gammaproteobacteria bacterium]